MPPTMTAAKTSRRYWMPIWGLTTPMRPRSTPEVEAKPQLIAHAAYVTRFVSIPVAFASSKLSAVARIAFTWFVYLRRTCMDEMNENQTTKEVASWIQTLRRNLMVG